LLLKTCPDKMEFGKYDVERVNEIDFQNNDLALYIMVVMVAHCEP